VEATNIGRALPEEAHGDPVFASILRLERGPGGKCKVAADDAPAPEEPPLDIEEVHRTAQAARAAGVFTEKLCHRGVGRHSASERDAMVAVRLKDVVAIFEDFCCGDRDRLLPDVQMEEPADVALGVVARRLLFEAANHHHHAVLSKKVILVRQCNPHSRS